MSVNNHNINQLPIPEFQRRFLKLPGHQKINFISVEMSKAGDDLKAEFFSFILNKDITREQVNQEATLLAIYQTLQTEWPLITEFETSQELARTRNTEILNQTEEIKKLIPFAKRARHAIKNIVSDYSNGTTSAITTNQ